MMEIRKIITGALEENCYVLIQNKTCLLIDPGSDSKAIKDVIADNKLLAILITHGHFDHIGALRDFLKENKRLMVYKKSNLKDQEIKEIGDFKFQVLYTPGHSSDSVSFYFEEEKIMFTGDFLFYDTVGRCDLPTGDIEQMYQSMDKILTYPDDIKIYCGHGIDTTLGREKKENQYLLARK